MESSNALPFEPLPRSSTPYLPYGHDMDTKSTTLEPWLGLIVVETMKKVGYWPLRRRYFKLMFCFSFVRNTAIGEKTPFPLQHTRVTLLSKPETVTDSRKLRAFFLLG